MYVDAINKRFGQNGDNFINEIGLTARRDELPQGVELSDYDIYRVALEAESANEKRIYKTLGIPPVLVGVSESGQLGDTKQIADSLKMFAAEMTYYQTLIQEAFTMVFGDNDYSIKPLNLIDAIDSNLYKSLDVNELRMLLGIAPINEGGGDMPIMALDSAAAAAAMQQTIVAYYNTPNMPREAAVNMLMILFNISQEKAQSLINEKITIPPAN
jgi:hypothetical protein